MTRILGDEIYTDLKRAADADAEEIIALREKVAELVAVLEKIADIRYNIGNTSAASLAKSALDTIRLLQAHREPTQEEIAAIKKEWT